MRRDEDWWDASGKDLWRWEQELVAMDKSTATPRVETLQDEQRIEEPPCQTYQCV